jgi:RNA polymerase sigma-70 factor (family 1)
MKITNKTFRVVYDEYFEPLCRFLNYYTKDLSVIEEVVQDVFVRLWEDRDTVEIQYIKTYLYNAARNKILNYIRDERNRNVLLEQWAKRELENQSADDCVDMNEFVELLQETVQTLPPVCKEIFTMSREQNMSYRQIADERGLSVKTVEAQMGIALKRIRTKMAAYYAALTKSNFLISFIAIIKALLINNH